MKELKKYVSPELYITDVTLTDVLTSSPQDHDTTWDDDYIF